MMEDGDLERSPRLDDRPRVIVHEHRSKGDKPFWVLLLVALVMLAGGAFLLFTEYLPLRDELSSSRRKAAALEGEKGHLRDRIQALEQAIADAKQSSSQLAEELEKKEKALAEIEGVRLELAERFAQEVAKGEIMLRESHGELVVDLVDKLLFRQGEAEVNDRGKQVLRQVADTFRRLEHKVIQVGGHTDAVPISEKLREKFPSNWELATARATHVVRFLQDECQLPGERLLAAGFSQYRPVATNKTSQGRKKNRRIEVILLPRRGAK